MKLSDIIFLVCSIINVLFLLLCAVIAMFVFIEGLTRNDMILIIMGLIVLLTILSLVVYCITH